MRNALSKPDAISRIELTKHLLRTVGLDRHANDFTDEDVVYAMDDSGMGSFSFAGVQERGLPTVGAIYKDEDEVEVQITLYTGDGERPTEVEFWKVNFEPLISFPSPNQLIGVHLIR